MRGNLILILPIAASASLAVAGLALLPAAGAATTPAGVSFADDQHSVSGAPGPGYTFDVVAIGTSTASGAIDDTFTVTDHAVLSGTGELDVDRVLQDANGNTITMNIEGRFGAGTATTETVTGYWNITGGTGSFAAVHGTGTYAATIDPETHHIVGTLTGFVSFGAPS